MTTRYTPRTVFAGPSPWAAQQPTQQKANPAVNKKPAAVTPIHRPAKAVSMPPGVIGVSTDAIVIRSQKGRYDEWFDTLKAGNCIKCELDQTESIAGYLRRYVSTYKKPWKLSRSLAQPDGIGRIWIRSKT